jgi:hypothetical protein
MLHQTAFSQTCSFMNVHLRQLYLKLSRCVTTYEISKTDTKDAKDELCFLPETSFGIKFMLCVSSGL